MFGKRGLVAAKTVDRRVQRTRQLLLNALLSLIQDKGFEALTVQDVIDRANVGRATFYAHFENKEDLLVSGLEDFRAAITAHQRRLLQETRGSADRAFLFVHELLAHVAAHRDVFRAMVGKRSGAMVQRLVQKIVLDLVRDDLKPLLARTGDRALIGEAAVQYIAAGLWGLLAWWVDAKRNVSVEEMEAAFRQLAVPSVKAMLR